MATGNKKSTKNDKKKLAVRIVCIVMAVLMVGLVIFETIPGLFS